MFKLIDYYLMKKFLTTIFFSLLTMIFVYIFIDLFDNLHKFIDAETPLMGYFVVYTLRTPEIISQIFPAIVFMSLLFTFGSLNKYMEITAFKASGIGFYRISRWFIIVGILLTIGHFFFSQKILPVTSRMYYEEYQHYLKRRSRFSRRHDEIAFQEKNKIVYMKYYDQNKKKAQGVSLQYLDSAKLYYRIDAKEMFWSDRFKKWFVTNANIRDMSKDTLEYKFDHQMEVNLKIKPEELTDIDLKPIEMSWFELTDYINKKQDAGIDVLKWEVEKHSKVSYSAATLVMLLIGLPLSAGRVRSSVSLNFSVTFTIAFSYYIMIILFKNWGMVGAFDPLASAWIPNVLFLIISAYLFAKVKS